jgi:hypothetical protein
MLRFAFRTGVRLLLASALTTLATSADAQRHQQGSFSRLLPHMVGPGAAYGPPPNTAVPNGLYRHIAPPIIGPSGETARARDNAACGAAAAPFWDICNMG